MASTRISNFVEISSIFVCGAGYFDRNDKFSARPWGWYLTHEEALARMNRDKLFFENRHYDIGLIETYNYGDATIAKEEWWFKPVYGTLPVVTAKGMPKMHEHTHVMPCSKPQELDKIVSFLF